MLFWEVVSEQITVCLLSDNGLEKDVFLIISDI